MITPTTGMPFDVYQTMQATMYRVHPNSEHISPPVDKKKMRVVEPSTRSSVNMDLVKSFNEKQEKIQDLRIQKYLQTQQNKMIDIEVK